jgi:hypothetical protein
MLLVVVLTMIVALTIGLSIASRTVTNLRISRQNEESERAFQAAEAGIAQVLQSGSEANFPNFSNNSSYEAKVVHPGNASFVLNGGELVDQDTGIDVWLSNYPDFVSGSMNGNISVYWGSPNQDAQCTDTNKGALTKPAIEIVWLSGNKLDPSLSKRVYDFCGRISGADVPEDVSGLSLSQGRFLYRASFPVNNGLIMKVIPIFNSSKVFVSTNSSFPSQGTIVESTGKSGDTVRKIRYFSSYPQIPIEMFPYSLITQ